MTRLVFSLTLLPLAFAPLLPAAETAADWKDVFGESYLSSVKVVEIKDLDRITVVAGGHKTVVALAGVLPFSAWPLGAAKAADELRTKALDNLRSELVDQENVSIGLCREPTEPNAAPLVLMTRLAPTLWRMHKPSGRWGWGVTNYNLLCIESGYSPVVRQAASLKRYANNVPAEMARDALEVAKNGKAGIWGPAVSLGADLDLTAAKLADPPTLVLDDLNKSAFPRAVETLLNSVDTEVEISAVRAAHSAFQQSLDAETRRRVVELLMRCYRTNPDHHLRTEILYALNEGGRENESLHAFMHSVAEHESDPELKEIAESDLRSIGE